jgi:hypothetical protein
MHGQWQGQYAGSNSGSVVIDIDDFGDHYEGYAYLHDANPALPGSYAILRTDNKSNPCQFKAAIFPLDRNGQPTGWQALSPQFPGVVFPATADIDAVWTSKELSLQWKTDIGTQGTATLPKTKSTDQSEYQPQQMSWSEFKAHVVGLPSRRFIFRGQRQPWRLRTSFHRTGRADLRRFLQQDIQTLYKTLSARTRHIFDLTRADENGAFFHLIQHHGYPTPLLDWTFSPFVAVYFSYQPLHISSPKVSDNVRIFKFDQQQWRADFNQLENVTAAGRHFSIIEFIAIDNERMIPQQSLSSLTNVDDVETYIRARDNERNKQYLTAIDIPFNEREIVLRELTLMNITAGSLFPGLDGACEEIRARYFGQ